MNKAMNKASTFSAAGAALVSLIALSCRGELANKKSALVRHQVQVKKHREGLKQRIEQNLQVVKAKDKGRVFDCLDDKRTPWPQPMRSYHRINYFNSANLAGEKNGFVLSNGWPMLLSMHNYQNYLGPESKVFVTFRGMEWGIHKTPMSKYLVEVLKPAFPNDVLVMPDSYLFVNHKKNDLNRDKVMAVCHSRTYRNKERISQYWPGFDNNQSWKLVDTFFPRNRQVYLIGWSNGSYPRSQFIETEQIHTEKFNYRTARRDLKGFLERYKSSFRFVSRDNLRIAAIVDIETNYSSKKPLWNLAKYLDEVVQVSPRVLYYGSCSLSMSNVINYVRLIKLFDLEGQEMSNGVVRYRNRLGNIIIDILPHTRRPYYRTARVNLLRDTSFKKAKKITRRIRRNHNQMVDYSLKELIKFIKTPQKKFEV